jgi:hypothetical protein
MRRLSPLLFVIVLSTQLLAQSRNDGLDAAATNLISNVATYCNTVEHHSNYSLPRVFARISSADDWSGWIEYRSTSAWIRAGRPQPMAFVWYQGFKIVHVAITPNEASNPMVFADYCYREDGSLARIRSMPSTQDTCEPNRYRCSLVLREARFYPPDGGPAVTTFTYLDHGGYLTPPPDVINGPLLPEHTVVTHVPMKWPEYLHVTDLPFSGLLFPALR